MQVKLSTCDSQLFKSQIKTIIIIITFEQLFCLTNINRNLNYRTVWTSVLLSWFNTFMDKRGLLVVLIPSHFNTSSFSWGVNSSIYLAKRTRILHKIFMQFHCLSWYQKLMTCIKTTGFWQRESENSHFTTWFWTHLLTTRFWECETKALHLFDHCGTTEVAD